MTISKKHSLIGAAAVSAVAFVFYSITAYPTITWWDSSAYSLAAAELGVTGPPGSIMLVLLGWIVTKLPTGLGVAHSLNLFAGLLASLACAMVFRLATRLLMHPSYPTEDRRVHWVVLAGTALACLILGLGETLWLYAVKFTPYVLTALMTGLILWAMLRWWEESETSSSIKWLLVIGLLFGLDFCVHRTNSLLIPGLFFWILLRNPKTLIKFKAWIAGIAGLLIGMSVHLLSIPMAASRPFLNVADPGSFESLWDYIALKQAGGGFLMDILNRKGDLFADQVMSFVGTFADNFASAGGPIPLWGLIPFLLGLLGLILIWRNHGRLGLAYLILVVMTTVTAIAYFNVPADFFRSMDRHYLPILVIFAVWVAYAAGYLLRHLWQRPAAGIRPLAIGFGLVLLSLPIHQAARNWRNADGSSRYFAHDTACNYLEALPRDAILFTYGDNDSFPLWYMQQVEGVRTDVTVCNIPLTNTSYYVSQLLERDPDFPLSLTDEERLQLNPVQWEEKPIAIIGAQDPARFNLPDSIQLPDSVRIVVRPTVADRLLLAQDQILLRILAMNRWQRPICFAGSAPSYLQPLTRPEGITQRIMPVPNPPVNADILRENLLKGYAYRGFADPDIPIEWSTNGQAVTLMAGFLALMQTELSTGNAVGALEAADLLEKQLPIDRLDLPENYVAGFNQLREMARARAGE